MKCHEQDPSTDGNATRRDVGNYIHGVPVDRGDIRNLDHQQADFWIRFRNPPHSPVCCDEDEVSFLGLGAHPKIVFVDAELLYTSFRRARLGMGTRRIAVRDAQYAYFRPELHVQIRNATQGLSRKRHLNVPFPLLSTIKQNSIYLRRREPEAGRISVRSGVKRARISRRTPRPSHLLWGGPGLCIDR